MAMAKNEFNEISDRSFSDTWLSLSGVAVLFLESVDSQGVVF